MIFFDFIYILQPLLNLLILVALGWVVGKVGHNSEELTRGLVYLLMRVTLPALIVVIMQRSVSAELLWQSLETLLWSLGFYALIAVTFTLAKPILPVQPKNRNLLQFVTLFGNVGFMGFPIMEVLFGRESLFLAAIFNLPFNFIIFTYGVILLSQNRTQEGAPSLRWREVFLTPIMISLFVSLTLFLAQISLPPPVLSFLNLTGGITTPLSMITVGIMLSRVSVRQSLVQPDLWVMALGRLVIAPMAVLGAALLVPVSLPTVWTAVILTAMPAAANTPILALEHRGPHQEASQVVLLTSLLVFITLPLILMVLRLVFADPVFR